MLKRLVGFALFFALILAAFPAVAQFETPLIIFYGHQLWTPDESSNSLIPFSACPVAADEPIVWRPDGSLALSPDGTQLAYTIQPAMVTEAIERFGGFGGGELPSSIVLCDLQTGVVTTVGGQPENAAFFDLAGGDSNTMHSLPAWSPDGTQLAWTQFSNPDLDEGRMTIMRYDLASGQTTQIAQLPPQYGVPVTVALDWSDAGILLRNQQFVPPPAGADPMLTPVNDTLDILDPSTGELHTIYTVNYEAIGEAYLEEYFWVKTEQGWQVVLSMSNNSWTLIDPATGNAAPLAGVLTYSIPDTLSRIATPIMQDFGGILYRWLDISSPDQPPVAIGYETAGRLTPPALSLSALYAFPTADNSAIMWAPPGSQSPLPLPTVDNPYTPAEVVWGAGAVWGLLPPEAAPDLSSFIPTQASTCPDSMPARLTIGAQGYVSDDLANNVRSEPSTAGDLLGQIPAGSVFTVLEGPVCEDDLVWWRVSTETVTGWTAEGMDGEYWLSPLDVG